MGKGAGTVAKGGLLWRAVGPGLPGTLAGNLAGSVQRATAGGAVRPTLREVIVKVWVAYFSAD